MHAFVISLYCLRCLLDVFVFVFSNGLWISGCVCDFMCFAREDVFCWCFLCFFQWIPCLYACVCVFIFFASSPVFEVWSDIFFPWIPCFLDAFVFSNVLLASMFSGCVCLCFSHGFLFFGCVYVFICFASYAVFRMCAYMFFHFIPCFLDAFVISCVLLAPLFSECVSSYFFT